MNFYYLFFSLKSRMNKTLVQYLMDPEEPNMTWRKIYEKFNATVEPKHIYYAIWSGSKKRIIKLMKLARKQLNIIDITGSITCSNGKISCVAQECIFLCNYLQSLNPKSIGFQECKNYIISHCNDRAMPIRTESYLFY